MSELAEFEPLRGHHFLDFVQARFAEVLAGEQFLLGAASQIAERHDAHLLQAVTAADGQLEIGDRNAEHLVQAVAALIFSFSS